MGFGPGGRPGGGRPTAASAASSAASSSRSATTPSSASSRGTSSRSTRASSARRASSATSRAAIPTACSTRSCVTPRRPRGSGRVSWDEALDRVVGGDPPHPGDLRRRRVRHALGRLAHQREELPHRQVRPSGAAHREPRLQRPLLHGLGRRRQQEGARHRPQRQPLERHPARRRGLGGRVRTWPRRSRSRRATSGGPAIAAPG